ncbi:MAG: 5-formyltetrahydrofolate cyclo-ligase [Methylocystaceae bacterium]
MQNNINYSTLKKEIRQQVVNTRQALTTQEIKEKSERIANHFEQVPALTSARTVMGYAPFRNEVDIFPWLIKKYEQGVTILLPRTVAATGDLEAVPFVPGQQMLKNKLGVSEPLGSEVEPRLIEAVIVPGVVFDRRGYRLGYGKGFYDRFLPRLRKGAFACGVAFELQMVDEVPHEEHDYRLSCLVTEQGVRWI